MAREKVVKYDVDGQPIKWHEVDPATLSPHEKKAYDAYKAKYAEAAKLRDTFQDVIRSERKGQIPAGRRLVCGYNYGKFSITTLVDAEKRSTKAVSLAEALKG